MRSRWNFLFLTFCMALLVGLQQAYHQFQIYFSPIQEMQQQILSSTNLYQHEKLRVAILENQFFDFQQEVAEILPTQVPRNKEYRNFQLRSLASVTRKPLEGVDFSSSILQRGKDSFRRADYRDAVANFKKVQINYPASPHNIEASFFLAESYFLTGQYQECLDVVDLMMLQYPDNELTGFIMLRMGQIFQSKSRFDEAKEVYGAVRKAFVDQRDLASQAEQLLKSVE